MNKQSIVFAHYKQGKLLGYRQDTFGTLGTDWAKIYQYSPAQVETVLTNIRYTLGEKKPGIGELLEQFNKGAVNTEGQPISFNTIKAAEDRIYQQGQDAGAFEVRVLKCPVNKYETIFDVKTATYKEKYILDYPKEEMDIWLANADQHETLETYYFSMLGQLNPQ